MNYVHSRRVGIVARRHIVILAVLSACMLGSLSLAGNASATLTRYYVGCESASVFQSWSGSSSWGQLLGGNTFDRDNNFTIQNGRVFGLAYGSLNTWGWVYWNCLV